VTAHDKLWQALRDMRPGEGADVGGRRVVRLDGRHWSVDGGPGVSLLVAIDRLADWGLSDVRFPRDSARGATVQ
jgi:hypothetical protein